MEHVVDGAVSQTKVKLEARMAPEGAILRRALPPEDGLASQTLADSFSSWALVIRPELTM